MSRQEKYARLGYKRLILDYHYSEYVPHTLEKADPQEIVDAMDYLGIDSLLLYAKDQWGNVYHRTKISHQHKNVPYDLFGQVSQGLKQKGIETISYFTVCWDEGAARAHPEWKVVSRTGGPVLDGGDDPVAARWAFLCLNTPYREYVLTQARELVENYDMGALFLDIILYWPGANDCYCPYCQEKWRAKYGQDIPISFTPEDTARYVDFMTETLAGFCIQVSDIIKSSRKDIWLTHNYGLFYGHDDYAVMEIDPFGRDFFRSSHLAKTFRARFGGGEVELIGHRHNSVWDFTVKPALTLQWEAATAIAHDCAIMFVDQPNIKGDLDPLTYRTMKKAFETADELIPHVRGITPYADMLLLDSERSMTLNGEENRDQAGAYRLLSELHAPFDIISDTYVTLERLQQFPLLIVPDTTCLSKDVRETILQYVRAGGNLLLCHRSATADEMGRALLQDEQAFGFVRLLGASSHLVEFVRPVVKDIHEDLSACRLKIKGSERFAAPSGAEVLATRTPPCIDVTATEWVAHRPMPGIDTDEPAVALAACGKGKFIYWGSRIFKEYLLQDHPPIREFVDYCIRRLVTPTIEVAGPRMLEAVYARKENTFKVFLINGITSKPCMHQAPNSEEEFAFHVNIDEIVPIHDVTIEMRNRKIVTATDIAGRLLKHADGRVYLPRVALYDVVTVEMA